MSDVNVFCTITALNGAKVPITVLADTTPTGLRQLVAKETKIPLDQLRLIFRGRMIKDDDSIKAIEEYRLESDSVLHCMGKPVEDLPDTSPSVVSASASASAGAATASAASVTSSATPLSALMAGPTTGTNLSVPRAATAAPSSAVAPTAALANSVPAALMRLRTNNPPSIYQTALTTLERILVNITDNPMEEKYRKVKRQNAAFQKRLGGLVGGHDMMLAVGFVVEIQGGTEVYQLHASPEQWPRLVHAKEQVEAAVQQAKTQQTAPSPADFGVGGGSGLNLSSGGFPGMMGGAGGMGTGPIDPNMQNAMTQMMSNPDALRAALQNPMIQNMIRNDPNVSPMMGAYLEQMANNPALLELVTQRMQDPVVRAQMQGMMTGADSGAGMPGMLPGGGMGAAMGAGIGNTANASASQYPSQQQQQQQGSDQDQTEDEMIAEAIRRSLEES